MIYPAFAAEYDQVVSTSDGTLDVGIYTIPAIPNTEEPTKLKIDFLKSGTERIQQHIDYRVSVWCCAVPELNQERGEGKYVFGPMTRLLHTSPGSITIPVEFSVNYPHIVHIEMEGILFQPIPLETASFTLNVGQAETSIPDWIKTMPLEAPGRIEMKPFFSIALRCCSAAFGDLNPRVLEISALVGGKPFSFK